MIHLNDEEREMYKTVSLAREPMLDYCDKNPDDL